MRKAGATATVAAAAAGAGVAAAAAGAGKVIGAFPSDLALQRFKRVLDNSHKDFNIATTHGV